MPNIVEYTSKSGITPSDKGINAAQDAARMYSQVGDQVGRAIGGGLRKIGDAVERHMSIMESSELYATGTELEHNVEQRWVEYSAQPENRGNPHAADQFMAEIAPVLDQWGAGASTDHGKQLATTLKASIRNKIFNRVAADQAEMDSAHFEDNMDRTMNLLGVGLFTDPSEVNFRRTLGTAEDAIQSGSAAISDVSMREQQASRYKQRYLPQLVANRYQGVANSIKEQVAATGDEASSTALQQLDKDIASQLGFEYLSPEMQAKLPELRDRAVAQGQQLYESKISTAKSKMSAEGDAAYAEIHNRLTNRALQGQGPTPEDVTDIQNYSRTYGASNKSEAASLDSYVLQSQTRALTNTVQPFSQTTRDNIQAGFSLPVDDPRRPTQASLLQAYSHGQITKQDLSDYTQVLEKTNKPETDPAFKPAWDAFGRWMKMQVAGIQGAYPGAARNAYIHDVIATFMARGRANGWDEALKWTTDANHPGAFGGAEIKSVYQRAANQPDGAGWLRDNAWQVREDGSIIRPWKPGTGGGRPAAPSAGQAAPAAGPPPAPKIDQKAVDAAIWGGK